MKKRIEWDRVLGVTILILIFVVIIYGWARFSYNIGYYQGQKDALDGKWQYEKVIVPDTTIIYKEIK